MNSNFKQIAFHPIAIGILTSLACSPVWKVFGLQIHHLNLLVAIISFHSAVAATFAHLGSASLRKHRRELGILLAEKRYVALQLERYATADAIDEIADELNLQIRSEVTNK